MFYDAAAKPLYPGKVTKVLEFSPLFDSALPSWLTTIGTSPVVTFGQASSGPGNVGITTKTATPAIGDQCGIKPIGNIATAQFEEISFILYGLRFNNANADTGFLYSNGSLGLEWKYSQSLGYTTQQVFPNAAVKDNYNIYDNSRHDLGITFRRATKEIFLTCGDPYEGAGVVGYDVGNLGDFTGQTPQFLCTAQTAAIAGFSFEKIKLRTVSF